MNFDEIIKEYFKDRSLNQINNSSLKKFFSLYPEIEKYLNENIDEYFKTPYEVLIKIIFNYQLKVCKVCGKFLTYQQSRNDKIYCSTKCSANCKDKQEKVRNVWLEKYGVENISQAEIIKKKKENTCLQHYGVKSTWRSKEIQEKIRNTYLEKYGTIIPQRTDLFKEKSKQTCLEKYGVSSYSQSEEMKEKSKQTCLEKYGVEYPSQSDEIQNTRIENSIKKYGKRHISIFKSWKRIQSWTDKIPMFTFNEFNGATKNLYKWKCTKCGNEYFSRYFNGQISKCPHCEIVYGYSLKEKELVDFCKQYFPNLKENDRTLIKPLELDIVIDELKLAIEFNGLYWHSILIKPEGYHLNKVLKCNSVGYRLIHIWEDEWNELTKQKLIDIFEGKEIIDFSKPLDRSWYNNLSGNFEELPPEIIIRDGFEVENCGYLKLY